MDIENRRHNVFLTGALGFLLVFLWGVLTVKMPLVNIINATLGFAVSILLNQVFLFFIHFKKNTKKEGTEDYIHKKV